MVNPILYPRQQFKPLTLLVTPGAQAFARGFNQLIRQQVWAAHMLALHSGKTLRVCAFGQQLNFTIDSLGALAVADTSILPDVTVSFVAERVELAQLIANWPKVDLVRYINVAGEASLAQVLSVITKDLRPEPEDALSNWVGDIGARRITGVVASIGRWATESAVRATQNVSEYLTFEAGMLVDPQSRQAFESDVGAAALGLDDLAMRLQRLSQRLDRLTVQRQEGG